MVIINHQPITWTSLFTCLFLITIYGQIRVVHMWLDTCDRVYITPVPRVRVRVKVRVGIKP